MSLPTASVLGRGRRFPGLLRSLSPFPSASPSLLAVLGVGLVCACSVDSVDSDVPSQGTGAQDQAGGTCNVVPKSVSGLSQVHVSVCSQLEYPDDPPAGGEHYPNWAAYQSYSFSVPRGFWVHDLEHGGVVYSYNCADSADGCADEVAQVQAMIDALPADPECPLATPRRVVLTPDPLLTARWGVSAWGFTLRADCVDTERFRQFYLNHFALGPENLCNPGIDFGGTPPCE